MMSKNITMMYKKTMMTIIKMNLKRINKKSPLKSKASFLIQKKTLKLINIGKIFKHRKKNSLFMSNKMSLNRKKMIRKRKTKDKLLPTSQIKNSCHKLRNFSLTE